MAIFRCLFVLGRQETLFITSFFQMNRKRLKIKIKTLSLLTLLQTNFAMSFSFFFFFFHEYPFGSMAGVKFLILYRNLTVEVQKKK